MSIKTAACFLAILVAVNLAAGQRAKDKEKIHSLEAPKEDVCNSAGRKYNFAA